MKDQILKIAKVKSEKEFYKKYPTEEAFMAKHGKAFKKAAMGASMVNDQLHQLTDFGNPPIAEVGAYIGGSGPVDKRNTPFSFTDIMSDVNATNAGITRQQYDKNQQQAESRNNAQTIAAGNKSGGGIGDLLKSFGGAPMSNRNGGYTKAQWGDFLKQAAGTISGAGATQGGGFDWQNSAKGFVSGLSDQNSDLGKSATKLIGAEKMGKITGALGKAAPYLQSGLDVANGIGQMKQQDANIKEAHKAADVSGLTAQAAESQPEQARRKYVRPEDSLVQPGQMNSPQGTGTNYLAQNGAEIQNTYAPDNLYGDLGYEPLNDSNPKQYAHGGELHKASFGDYFQDSGQASIGRGVGSAIGTFVGGPLGGKIGGLLGTVAGNALGGADDANKLRGYQDTLMANKDRAAWARGANAIHAQNSTFMKDGGYTDSEHAWVSNGWQPQVITKFGEHSMKDLLQPPHDADMLRAGGHLSEYTPPSAEAMYTGRSQYAMGGDLQVHRGKAETMSYNPFLPDGGETVMFRGPSHDDGGMPVNYGENGVEVEGGEPAVKLQDGGNAGDSNLVVFGNMVIPDYGVTELGDKNAKGKKFKHYVADLSKKEAKHNKTIEKAIDLVNDADTNNVFDQLSLNAGKAMLMGSNLKLKDIADKKQTAAMVQNAILDTAREFGVESDGLAKGKIRAIKDPSIGRDGKMLSKAQNGVSKSSAKSKWKEFENEVTSQLKSLYPGKKVQVKYENSGVYNSEGGRPIATQSGIQKAGNSQTPVSLHNFDAAKDYNIYIDGKLLNADKYKNLYSKVLWDSAAKTGLYHVGDTKNNWDPRHISLAQEGQGTAFDELHFKYPEIFDSSNAIQSQNWISQHKNDSDSLQKYYDWTTNIKPFGNSVSQPVAKPTVAASASASAKEVAPTKAPVTAAAPVNEAPAYVKVGPAPQLFPIQPEDVPVEGGRHYDFAGNYYDDNGNFVDQGGGDLPNSPVGEILTKKDVKKNDKTFSDIVNNLLYSLPRRSNQMPLDANQLSGEMYALGNNQLEGVQAQTFQPMLDNVYDISLQDQINAIDSQSRAAIRAAGNDPAAQAYIMSQAADQKNKVLGEQFRMNQANKAQVYQGNRQALNQAQLQNLGILDKQYERQETAKSKTKAQTIAALSSISDKIAKNKLENRKLGLYENMYGFRFDDKGRAYNVNGPAQINMTGNGKSSRYSNLGLEPNQRLTIDSVTGKPVGIRTLTKAEMEGSGSSPLSAASALGLLDDDTTNKNGGKIKKSRNGSIVKAVKLKNI